MIPVEHAHELKERCFGPCTFVSPENMTHNRFDVYDDLIKPLKNFFVDDVYSNSDDEEDELVDNFGKKTSLNNSFLKSIHNVSLPNLNSLTTEVTSGPKFSEEFFIPPQKKIKKPIIEIKMLKKVVNTQKLIVPKTLKFNKGGAGTMAKKLEFKQTEIKSIFSTSSFNTNVVSRTPSSRSMGGFQSTKNFIQAGMQESLADAE